MIYLKKLTRYDNKEVFNMLKGIKAVENSFTNPAHDMTLKEFQEWLIEQEQWDSGEMLPDGFVAQSIYWLYDDSEPVGIGKIRHQLTESSRQNGGNIGYAISEKYRGKGYGKKLLQLLLLEAKKIGVAEILLAVDKGNEASKIICQENGGILIHENEAKCFFSFSAK